jgi:hypothetical protein
MLDPRIYRMGLLPVVLAVMVLAFSLGDQPGGLNTNLAPDAYNPANAYQIMAKLGRTYPSRRPGSIGDQDVASYVARQLRGYGFDTTTDTFDASTADGRRTLENVVGVRAGLQSGSIVVVAHRDALTAPATASLSGTAVLLEMARVLAGRSQHHTIVLASTSGSVGAAGARELARHLSGPVDAVIVLGDLAGVSTREPIVVPWSDGQRVAPPALRNTVDHALRTEMGLPGGWSGLGGQIARLALPVTSSEQAPFNSAGEPAVLFSLASEQGPTPAEPVSKAQITGTGRTVLRTLTALDAGATLPGPSSYLVWGGKIVPAWAVRLLILTLVLPVLGATIDGLARARRRGQTVMGAVTWVLLAGLPFALAAMLVLGVAKAGWLGATPAGPLGAAGVALHPGGIAVMVAAALVVAAGLAWLWPALTALIAPGSRRFRAEAQDAGAAAGLLLVLCAVTLAIWISNPFAAALLVPALHLWLWIVVPDVRVPAPAAVVLLGLGLAPPVLAILYYPVVFGLGPVTGLWHWMLALGGGVLSPLSAIEWSIVAGCAVSVISIGWRRLHRQQPEETPITVRGPVTYAGPGSLGGTESALRR